MTLTNTTLSESLWKLANAYVEQYENTHGYLPLVEHDELWPSICQQSSLNDQLIHWKPMCSNEDLYFDNIESALEISLHQDIKTYYSTFFSEAIDTHCNEGSLSLLFAWNKDDFQRLQENIIGHILMKQRLKHAVTIFFAVTDEDDTILSLQNDTGEVWVEKIGCEPHKKVANSLNEFINQLKPKIK